MFKVGKTYSDDVGGIAVINSTIAGASDGGGANNGSG
jgi:hypothetical protein